MRIIHLTGFAVLALAVASLLPCGPRLAADDRKAIPTDAEVMAKIAAVREAYKADYAKARTTTEKAALAAKILQQARETKDDPAGRYAMLLEARDLAAKGADAVTAMSAADELAADYQVKPGEVRAACAETLAATATSPTATLTVAQLLLTASAQARRADDWDSTITLLRNSGVAARKAGSAGTKLGTTATARLKEAEYFKAESLKAKAAHETLKTKPDDAEANLTVGKYVCFGREEFPEGVKYLAKGSDAKLKDAAAKDIKAETGGAAEGIAAADAWYDLAAGADPMDKPAMQVRAHSWYSSAAPDANGLDRTKAEKRAAELYPIIEARTDKSAIFVTIRKAIAEKRYKKWPVHGGGGIEFEEIPAEGGYLIGLDCTSIINGGYPGMVQPIWMTARGEVRGVLYGAPRKGDKSERPVANRPKPGYAIGAVQVRTGAGMDQIKPIFMRATDTGVNVNDKYDGLPVGGMGGGPSLSGGDGQFIIGILSRRDRTTGKIEGIGFVTMIDPRKKP